MKYRVLNVTPTHRARGKDFRGRAVRSHGPSNPTSSLQAIPAFGSDGWTAVYSELRGDVETLNTKRGDEAKPGRRPRKRDRTAAGRYMRRVDSALPAPTPDELRRRALGPDSTAAGLLSTQAGSTHSSQRGTSLEQTLVNGGDASPTAESLDALARRRLEEPAAGWTPKRRNKNSPKGALTPKGFNLPSASNDLAAPQADAPMTTAPSEFAALRDALLEKQRQLHPGREE
jgi:hypothetical protein